MRFVTLQHVFVLLDQVANGARYFYFLGDTSLLVLLFDSSYLYHRLSLQPGGVGVDIDTIIAFYSTVFALVTLLMRFESDEKWSHRRA